MKYGVSWSGAQGLSYSLPTKIIHAPTGRVAVFPVYDRKGRMVYLGATIIDGGTWVKYRNGELVY